MTTLSANLPRRYQPPRSDIAAYPMIAADIIYEGAAVGDNGAGYARPLVAGDAFRGFAFEKVDNAAGSAGDINIQVRWHGVVVLPIAGLAITDIGKDVYASDDDTFTLTQGGNTRIGYVLGFEAAGIAVVAFEAAHGVLTELTDNSGGTASDTLAAITDVPTRDAVASLAAKVNALIRARGN